MLKIRFYWRDIDLLPELILPPSSTGTRWIFNFGPLEVIWKEKKAC